MLIVVKHPLAWLQTMRERTPEGMHASFKRVCHHHSWEGRNRAIDAVRAHLRESHFKVYAQSPNQPCSIVICSLIAPFCSSISLINPLINIWLQIQRKGRSQRYLERDNPMGAFLKSLLGIHGSHKDGRELEAFISMRWQQVSVPEWHGQPQPPEYFESVVAMRTEKHRAILDALAVRRPELRYAVLKFEDLLKDSEAAVDDVFRRFRVGGGTRPALARDHVTGTSLECAAASTAWQPPWRSEHYWQERLPQEPEWHDLDGPSDPHRPRGHKPRAYYGLDQPGGEHFLRQYSVGGFCEGFDRSFVRSFVCSFVPSFVRHATLIFHSIASY